MLALEEHAPEIEHHWKKTKTFVSPREVTRKIWNEMGRKHLYTQWVALTPRTTHVLTLLKTVGETHSLCPAGGCTPQRPPR